MESQHPPEEPHGAQVSAPELESSLAFTMNTMLRVIPGVVSSEVAFGDGIMRVRVETKDGSPETEDAVIDLLDELHRALFADLGLEFEVVCQGEEPFLSVFEP